MARGSRNSTLQAGLTPEVLDSLIDGVRTPEDLEADFRSLKKGITERVLRTELTEHLSSEEGVTQHPAQATDTPHNERNGTTDRVALAPALGAGGAAVLLPHRSP